MDPREARRLARMERRQQRLAARDLALQPQEAPAPTPEPVKAAPQEGSWLDSVPNPLKVLKNAPKSFFDNAKAVLWDLPTSAAKSLAHYAANPEQYLPDLKLAFKMRSDIGGAVKDDYVDYYGNFARRFEEDPFRPVSDAAGLMSAGGGAAKAIGTAGAKALRSTARPLAGVLARSARVGRAASRLSVADPAESVLSSIGWGAGRALRSFGLGQNTKTLNRLKAIISAEADKEYYTSGMAAFYDGLNEAEQKLLRRLWAKGDIDEINNIGNVAPRVAEAYKRSEAWFRSDENEFTQKLFQIAPEEKEAALAKQMIRYDQENGQMVSPDTNVAMQDAIEKIRRGKNKPIYFSIPAKFKDPDAFDFLHDDLMRGGSLARKELRAATGELPQNPTEILANQLKASVNTKAKLRLFQAVEGQLRTEGKWKILPAGQADDVARDALRKQGYRPLQSPFYKKYLEVFSRAAHTIGESLRRAGDLADPAKQRRFAKRVNAVVDAVTDQEMKVNGRQAIDNVDAEVWVPDDVAAWMNIEFVPGTTSSWIGRMTRAVLSLGGKMPYYKALATVFNPRYWLPVAVGDAALSVLYGIHPNALKHARRLKELLPLELQSIKRPTIYMKDLNWFQRGATRAQYWAGLIDNYFKSSIYITELAKDAAKRGLLQAGNSLFLAEDAIRQVMADAQFAPNRWVDNLVDIARGRQKVMKLSSSVMRDSLAVSKINRQLVKVKDREDLKAFGEANKGSENTDIVYGPDGKPTAARGVTSELADEVYAPAPKDPTRDIVYGPDLKTDYTYERTGKAETVDWSDKPQDPRYKFKRKDKEGLEGVTAPDPVYGSDFPVSYSHVKAMTDAEFSAYLDSVDEIVLDLVNQIKTAQKSGQDISKLVAELNKVIDEVPAGPGYIAKRKEPLANPGVYDPIYGPFDPIAPKAETGDLSYTQGNKYEAVPVSPEQAPQPTIYDSVYNQPPAPGVTQQAEALFPTLVNDYKAKRSALLDEKLSERAARSIDDPVYGGSGQKQADFEGAALTQAEPRPVDGKNTAPTGQRSAAPGMYDPVYNPGGIRPGDVSDMPVLEQKQRVREVLYAKLSHKLEQKIRDLQESLLEVNKLEARNPRLEASMIRVDRAIMAANTFLGSYSRLSPFERKIMRELIPFYGFTKSMTMLAFRLPFLMPKRQLLYLGLWRLWEDHIDDQEFSSTWLREYTVSGITSDGKPVLIRHGSMNPMNSVRTTGYSDISVPTAWDVFGSHPVIKLIINAKGQVNPKPVSPGENAVRLDNGEVWRYTGKGFQRVVAQPSYVKQLWSLLPQTQMIDSMFLGAVQSDRGFLFNPDPVSDHTGKPIFPIGWQERVIGLLAPSTKLDKTALRNRERAKKLAIYRAYLQQAYRSPPSRRENIKAILSYLSSEAEKAELVYN